MYFVKIYDWNALFLFRPIVLILSPKKNKLEEDGKVHNNEVHTVITPRQVGQERTGQGRAGQRGRMQASFSLIHPREGTPVRARHKWMYRV